MVSNLNLLLDEGENKYVAEGKMANKLEQINKDILSYTNETITPEPRWDSDEEEYIQGNDIPNPKYKRITPTIQKWIDLDKKCWDDYALCSGYKTYLKELNARRQKILDDPNFSKKLYDFIEKIPFNPCVMINISPAWKGKAPPLVDCYRQLLDKTITTYISACNRYRFHRYCLECGSEGDFLHAHIVAEINPDLYKSVKTHINKGNHKYELMKIWDKICEQKNLKGMKGLLKGKYSIQRILLNSEQLRDDKLNYLEESKKPDGHTNLYDLKWVRGNF